MKVEMQHTEETIRRLSRVQYDTFCLAQKLVSFLVAVTLLCLGAVNCFDATTSLVLIAFGCFAITGMNAPADRNAKKILEYAKGNLPASVYEFQDACILINGDGQQTKLEYKEIYSLITDGVYLYLFISKFSAYMVPLKTLDAKAAEELKRMLEEKTGRTFERPGSLLSISMKSLKRSLRKT